MKEAVQINENKTKEKLKVNDVNMMNMMIFYSKQLTGTYFGNTIAIPICYLWCMTVDIFI